jgi:small subunit ribosomal protein S16
MDSRQPRDGAFIEQIGRYDPRQEPSLVEIDNERALVWLRNGAQPTDRARKLLEISGAWTRFRVDRGDIHTIEATAAPAAPAEEPSPVEASAPAAVEEAAPAGEAAAGELEPAGEAAAAAGTAAEAASTAETATDAATGNAEEETSA